MLRSIKPEEAKAQKLRRAFRHGILKAATSKHLLVNPYTDQEQARAFMLGVTAFKRSTEAKA